MPPVGYQQPAFDGSSAWSYAWEAFQKNVGPFIIIGVITTVISFVLVGGGAMLDGGFNFAMDREPGEVQFQVFQNIGSLLSSFITLILSLGILRMALDVMDGGKADLNRMFQGYNFGSALGTSLVTGLLMVLAACACFFPVLLVGPLVIFALPAAVEGMGVGDAINRSVSLVKENAGGVALFVLIYIGLMIVTFCTCGLAGIVITPLAYIALAAAYRQMTHGSMAQPV